eukprot:Platyproteum_vivax@DN9636_c0_g1_i1.p1
MHNHVAKRASLKQGSAFLDVTAATFPDLDLAAILALVADDELSGHFAVVWGAVMATMGISAQLTMEAYMFSFLRTTVAAGVREGAIGALQGQKLQAKFNGLIPGLIATYSTIPVAAACVQYPHLETLHACHDTFFSKMFYSCRLLCPPFGANFVC